MSRLRGTSRSQSSVSSLSSHSDAPLTPSTPQPSHSYRQLTLVPQMRTIKARSSQDAAAKPPTRSASLASSTLDADINHSSSQPRKQKTLDSFLVPKTHQLTAEQRRQQRRERKERKERKERGNASNSSNSRQRIATVSVDGEEDEGEEDARQQRLRRQAEVRARQQALKEERIDTEDEEDIPLFRIAAPTAQLPAAPSTPSSSSQSSLPSSLPSSLSSAIPSSVSPARPLKDEEDEDDWDIPAFVLQPQQSRPPPPRPPPQPTALPTPYQPPPPVPHHALPFPQPLPRPLPGALVAATLNPFAQSTLTSQSGGSGSVKAEWDDGPQVRLPLSQMLQSLSEAKAAAGAVQKQSAADIRVKQERKSSPSNKENLPPPLTAPAPSTPPVKPIKIQRSSPSSPSSPPPLEPATQFEPTTLQRHSSTASEQSVDSISSVEEVGSISRPERVKRERVAVVPMDEIEDEYEPLQDSIGVSAMSRGSLFPARTSASHSSSSAAFPMPFSAQFSSPVFFALPPSARPLHQPLPVHPHVGDSPLLTSPPLPSFQPPCLSPPLPSPHPPQYAGPVESWPLTFPQPDGESKQPMAMAGGGYSFRGISELQGQASVNYGQFYQPKAKRKRGSSSSSERKDEQTVRSAKSDKKAKVKKKTKVKGKKRRKTEGEADDEGEEEAEERKESKKKKKTRSGGRWCTVSGVRTFIVGGKRLIGSAAYMAYKQDGGEGSSSKKEKTSTKKTKKRKGSSAKKKGSKAKKEGKRRTDSSDSGEEEWQPGDKEDSVGEDIGSGEESAGSLADFIVDDSSEGD